MQELHVGAAAAETGWSARMLRYLERHGLVGRAGRAAGYRLYGLASSTASARCASCGACTTSSSTELVFARRLRREPDLRRAVDAWLAADDDSAPGWSGSSASTSGCSPPDYTAPRRRTRGTRGFDEATRREGSGARARGRSAHHVGRPADAGAAGDSRTVRAGAAARRLPRVRLPPRDDRDGEPDAHAEGGRRRRRALRVEPALDAGRRRCSARRRIRHPDVRDQGRGQRDLLLAHPGRGRPPPAADDGRRRRRDQRSPQRASRPARRDHRGHGGDDDRRHPPEGDGGRRCAPVPGDRSQRGAHEALLRQPLRHGPVDDRRDHPRDERPARRRAPSSSPATAGSAAAWRCARRASAHT